MKLTILAVAGALSMAAGAAFAAEGNSEPFPYDGPSQVTSNLLASDTGSQAYPSFTGRSVVVTAGGTLPSNGTQGIVQTANSLPRGFEDGTVAYAQAQSVSNYLQAQAVRAQASKLAQVHSGRPQG